MSSLQRRVGMLILIALLLSPIMLYAQDDGAVSVAGSGIPAPLVSAFAESAGVSAEVTVTGTNAGFAALCAGEADLTTATRAISDSEASLCAQNGVEFFEVILGYDILAVIANPDVPATCLPTLQLNTIFAPSATANNWNQVDATFSDLPLSVNVPPDNTSTFSLLDGLVEGVGVRDDASTTADSTGIISAVSSTSGALGVVSLPAALAAGDSVKILDLNTTTAGCASPSAQNAQGRTYTAAYVLYAYANSATPMLPILNAATGDGSAETITGLGFVPPTDVVTAKNQDILANDLTGRQFSQTVTTEFSIPENLVGTLNIAGAASGSSYLTAATSAFVQQFPGVTLNQTIRGQVDGFTKLCSGSVDLVDSFTDLPAEQLEACDSNNVPVETFNLGGSAVVLLGNGDFLTCLTTSEITTLWGAPSGGTVTNWNQINAAFPDLPITLVAPALGDAYGDLLMITASGENLPIRADLAEARPNAGYRAMAAGNVEGGITYTSWQDYQALTDEQKANVQVLGVDAGSGCVTPSVTTIADGTYALSRPLDLIVNRLSMARQEVQSLLWFMASDANYSLLASNGVVGLSFSDLPALRERLQQLFVQAAEEVAQAAADAANATPEATAEATAEATSDAPEAAATEPAPELTAEATEAS